MQTVGVPERSGTRLTVFLVLPWGGLMKNAGFYAYLVLLPLIFSGASIATDLNSLPPQAAVGQLAEFVDPDNSPFDQFGHAVAVSSGVVVVGSPTASVGSNSGQGAAYVFAHNADGWSEVARLTASDGASGDQFGNSVAIAGKTVAVGAYFKKSGRGAVYVFVRPANGWGDMTETAELTVPDQQSLVGSGVAVSGDGSAIVAGASAASVNGGAGSGAAYVFVRPALGWQNTTVPTATLSSTSATDLGNVVAISGNTVVAGSFGVNQQGEGYVFVEAAGGWQDAQPTATLIPSDGNRGEGFGTAVAIDGNTIIIGAPNHAFPQPAGAVYIFVRPPTGWKGMTETAELTVLATGNPALGFSVAIVGGGVIAGAPGDVIGNSARGAVFGYLRPLGGWKNTTKPKLSVAASDGAAGDGFGSSTALSSSIAAIGAPGHGGSLQGAAYVFGQK